MSTPWTAPPSILDRDLSKAAAQPAVDMAVPLLTEVVNYGCGVLRRCTDEVKSGDVHLGVFFPFMNLLEMLDGAQIIIAEAAPSGARPHVRAILEGLLAVDYITQPGVGTLSYAIRAAAWLVRYWKNSLRWAKALRRYDPGTAEGRALIDRQVVSVPMDLAMLDREIARYQSLLVKPPWKFVHDAGQRLLRGRGPWFHVSETDGLVNLERLADSLGYTLYYDMLYRQYSETVHGGDAARRILSTEPGGIQIRPLRDLHELGNIVTTALNLALDAIRKVLLTYRPTEDQSHALWYFEQIKPALDRFEKVVSALGL